MSKYDNTKLNWQKIFMEAEKPHIKINRHCELMEIILFGKNQQSFDFSISYLQLVQNPNF